jgi:hypothetical protein
MGDLPLPVERADREPLLNGELDELCVAFQPKLLHNSVLMKGNSAGGDMQDAGSLFHGTSFCKELKHFPLA